jgi:putative membrane protein
MQTKKLNIREFLKYKLLNSTFLGLSVGSIFILYAPLMPSVYSIGGIALAFAMLLLAKLYYKILNIHYFFRISLFVEFVLLFLVSFFLIFSYSYTIALIFYIGYQITFTFGSYLIRAETLFLKKAKALELVDVAKQKGYLLGMFLSYIFYELIEYFFSIVDKQAQVYAIHFLLLAFQLLIIYYLLKSFKVLK